MSGHDENSFSCKKVLEMSTLTVVRARRAVFQGCSPKVEGTLRIS